MGTRERVAAAVCALALTCMAGSVLSGYAGRRALPQAAYPEQDPAVSEEAAPAEDLLDLNTATLTELMSLPGIGERRAQAILDLRAQKGSFRRVEELLEVSGIGEQTLEGLMDHITVGG